MMGAKLPDAAAAPVLLSQLHRQTHSLRAFDTMRSSSLHDTSLGVSPSYFWHGCTWESALDKTRGPPHNA